SGGERSRLALAKLLLEPRNLLFLDEPTNHLDIFAAEILEEALVGFEGAVVLVSHDRRFLENVTGRVVAFTPTGVETFAAGFSDYEATIAKGKSDRERERADAKRTLAKAAEDKREAGRAEKTRLEAKALAPSPSVAAGVRHRSRQLMARALEKKR